MVLFSISCQLPSHLLKGSLSTLTARVTPTSTITQTISQAAWYHPSGFHCSLCAPLTRLWGPLSVPTTTLFMCSGQHGTHGRNQTGLRDTSLSFKCEWVRLRGLRTMLLCFLCRTWVFLEVLDFCISSQISFISALPLKQVSLETSDFTQAVHGVRAQGCQDYPQCLLSSSGPDGKLVCKLVCGPQKGLWAFCSNVKGKLSNTTICKWRPLK